MLVWQDMAGLTPNVPKFAKRYADVAGVLTRRPPSDFAAEVAAGTYPTPEYSYR